MLKIAILGSTRGTSLQPIIAAIENESLDAAIEIVISNKPDAYILERAKKYGIPSVYIDMIADRGLSTAHKKSREAYDRDIMHLLDQYRVEFVLLIGYMRILSMPFVSIWRKRIMNVHPSLLPKFSGGMDLQVHEAVLQAKEKETGCTIHFVDEGVDTGEIVVQKKCSVEPSDTAETLKAKVQALEGQAFIEAIKNITQKSKLKSQS